MGIPFLYWADCIKRIGLEMERVERIRNHPVYLEYLAAIEQAEIGRVFCCHGLEHALDVARIMYIIALEENLDFPKDVIYGVALLHDIGRKRQYEENIPHNEAGIMAAECILAECGYEKEEILKMTEAIRSHQKQKESEPISLNTLLYVADKKSRACYHCKVKDMCYWEKEKRNETVVY